MADLYFIANPALGIVKIGIADNVEQRKRTLECACGVALEILGVLPGGGNYEKTLHDAFGDNRLLGEWFNPTMDLLSLAADPSRVPTYLRENKVRISAWRAAKEAEESAAREAHRLLEEAHRAELKRIATEAKKKTAAQREKMQKLRDAKAEKRAAKAEAERISWAAQHEAIVARVTKPAAVATTQRRRIDFTDQRTRNAALLGVIPYETQRGASTGASGEN